eukprot:gene3531-2015_t
MEFESSILFFAMVYRFIAYSRASAIRKKQIMAKRAFLLARARRNRFLLSTNSCHAFWVLKEANLLRTAKRVWSIEKPQQWFDRLWDNEEFDTLDDYWKQEFRFSKRSFNDILKIVAGDMEKIDTKFRKAIPIQKRVAIALWRLSTGNSFRSTAAVFGDGNSRAVDITKQFCKFIAKRSSNFIKFPRNERETSIAWEKFSEICKIPQVIGAIDATHSPIDYFCREQKFTINTQAVVDGKLKFIDISTGFPGSIHDARVLRENSIYHTAERGDILNNPLAYIENQPVKPFIIGDGAYPLSSWLLKPYPDNGALTRSEIKYNKTLSSARSVVERAFGVLKARWRCLLKMLDNKTSNVVEVLITCCVLHNICEDNGDEVEDEEFIARVIEREQQGMVAINEDAAENNGANLRTLIKNFLRNN